MRNLYKHNKTGREIVVLFDIYETLKGICGITGDKDCDIKHYTCLDLDYNRETTTIDNLKKNYTLVINPDKKANSVLNCIRS